MNQLALGASFGFAAGAVLYAARRCRASWWMLLLVPALMAAGALWAVVPDLPRLIGWQDLYLQLSRDPRMDLFFWHYTIDLSEVHEPWHAPAVLVMLLGLLLAAWRELRLLEKERP